MKDLWSWIFYNDLYNQQRDDKLNKYLYKLNQRTRKTRKKFDTLQQLKRSQDASFSSGITGQEGGKKKRNGGRIAFVDDRVNRNYSQVNPMDKKSLKKRYFEFWNDISYYMRGSQNDKEMIDLKHKFKKMLEKSDSLINIEQDFVTPSGRKMIIDERSFGKVLGNEESDLEIEIDMAEFIKEDNKKLIAEPLSTMELYGLPKFNLPSINSLRTISYNPGNHNSINKQSLDSEISSNGNSILISQKFNQKGETPKLPTIENHSGQLGGLENTKKQEIASLKETEISSLFEDSLPDLNKNQLKEGDQTTFYHLNELQAIMFTKLEPFFNDLYSYKSVISETPIKAKFEVIIGEKSKICSKLFNPNEKEVIHLIRIVLVRNIVIRNYLPFLLSL